MSAPCLLEVWQKGFKFVKTMCSNRDDSAHGPEHAQNVALKAHSILTNDYTHKPWLFWKCTIIVALIHDVNDHKYPDPDGAVDRGLRAFLTDLNLVGARGEDVTNTLVLIANHVSYSKENNAIIAGNPLHFAPILNSRNMPDANEIRDIVSDADKLCALDRDGFARLIDYITSKFKKENGKAPTHTQLSEVVNHHSKEKLLRLKDKFIRTRHGKFLAIDAHNKFVEELEQFNKFPRLILVQSHDVKCS